MVSTFIVSVVLLLILILITEPPHKVTPTIQVNCTGIYASWPTPFFPPGCPILYYLLAINTSNSNVINTTDNDITFDLLPNTHYTINISAVNTTDNDITFDLLPNTLYTINISAVNSVGNSTKSYMFITAISE